MLIGSGGSGLVGSTGGGSGAVTVWYGAAQHVPDALIVIPGFGNSSNSTRINLRLSNSGTAGTIILQAASGSNGNGGGAITAPIFASFGFYQSTAGQDGMGTGAQTASATTFLSGGGYVGEGDVTANYGYSTNTNGYFQMQPIIVGVGGTDTFTGGIGCGGGNGGTGGQGMVLIASW
jgi:hypothetical protein